MTSKSIRIIIYSPEKIKQKDETFVTFYLRKNLHIEVVTFPTYLKK